MRGTTNRNARGSTRDRAARRAYLLRVYESDLGPGTCRCYRCGVLLTDPVDPARFTAHLRPLTVDRIVPGALGGRYTRANIRPACADCNSETGGKVRRT